MIIKTLTCHNVYNYGASLQAFALQEYLKQAGHLVEIIDYLPPYMDKSELTFIMCQSLQSIISMSKKCLS